MVRLQGTVPFIGILLLFHRITAIPQKYHLIHLPLTWYEAQHFCRVKHSDLATVNNMDDKNQLVNTLGSHVTHSWIGLQRGGTRRWMWSDGSGRAVYTKWNDGEPNNVAGREWCVEMSETGGWNDVSCDDEKGFVCYERRPNGQQRYVSYADKRNWVNSQKMCRSWHADMAYVHTELDSSDIATLVSGDEKMWIGLFNDAWVWSDGSETSFRYWLSGTPDYGNCASVSVSQQGRWVGAQCDGKSTFTCQGGLKVKRMLIRIKIRSDVTFVDSTISEKLLTKFETGLTLRKATDFTLSWRKHKNGLIFQRHVETLKFPEKTGC